MSESTATITEVPVEVNYTITLEGVTQKGLAEMVALFGPGSCGNGDWAYSLYRAAGTKVNYNELPEIVDYAGNKLGGYSFKHRD